MRLHIRRMISNIKFKASNKFEDEVIVCLDYDT
jgi:hypothetical protein